MKLFETAPLCAGPGASVGELEIEDGVAAGESEGESEGVSARGGDGGEEEDSGVNAVAGEGEIAGAGVDFLGEGAGEIRLPPPLDGAGAGD